MSVKVGLLQASVEPYEVQKNLDAIAVRLRQLKQRGVKLAVLPEFFPTGNTLEPDLLRVAIQSSDVVEQWLRDQARGLNMVIAGAYLNFDGSNVYNEFVVQEPDGHRVSRKKSRSPVPESIYYRVSEGEDVIVDTGIGRIGLIICVEMLHKDIITAGYRECSLVLIASAIPDRFMPFIRRRLIEVPPALAARNGIPVILCSMGGYFSTGGSPIVPFKFRSSYTGRSGIYLPDGPVAGPMLPDEDGVLVAEILPGPGVQSPDSTVKIEAGVPLYMRLFDALMSKRADKVYEGNLRRYLVPPSTTAHTRDSSPSRGSKR